MKSARRFFGWFFLAIGVLGLFQQPIAGLVWIAWGALLLPSTNQWAERQGWHLNWGNRVAIVLIGIVLINLTTPRQAVQQTAVSPASSTTPSVTITPVPSPSVSASVEQPPAPSAPTPTPEATSFSATVEKTGLDFSYQSEGTVEEAEQLIIVTYTRTWECGEGAAVATAQQQWQTVFDLASKTWTDKVKELRNCLGTANQEWIDYSTTPSQFSIETVDNETVLRADVQDTDGSMIVKNALVVRYTKQ